MSFQSILSNNPHIFPEPEAIKMPDFFTDLNLDQIIGKILEKKEEYRLESFFYTGLTDSCTINYRLQIMRDLEYPELFKSLQNFSRGMKKVREYIGFSQNIHNTLQIKKWHLDSVNMYCKATLELNAFLTLQELKSEGLLAFRQWLGNYINSGNFKDLYENSNTLYNEFYSCKYSTKIERDRLIIDEDDSSCDYSTDLIKTFEQINESAFDYKICFFTELEMCRLEKSLLEILQIMFPCTFSKLEDFCSRFNHFLEPVLVNFDRELQFYISYLEFIGVLKEKGLRFCYPCVSEVKSFDISGGYDLALASKLSSTGPVKSIIPNDCSFSSDERIAILTGPNQGGKTTYARAFGQILYLASIGCPVPCLKADIFLFDNLYTHFAEEERLEANAGRLKEELTRLRQITQNATSNSVIIINELFATTTSYDAFNMGKRILEYFIGLDCFCMYVTHIYELANISRRVTSYVAAVDAGNKEARTYKILRKSPDGQAYANTIAGKYHLGKKELKERIKS